MAKEISESFTTISQLIGALKKALDEHGDIPVFVDYERFSLEPLTPGDWYVCNVGRDEIRALCVLEV